MEIQRNQSINSSDNKIGKTSTSSRQDPSLESVDSFEKAMQKKDSKNSSDGNGFGNSQDSKQNNLSDMSSIFSSLMGGQGSSINQTAILEEQSQIAVNQSQDQKLQELVDSLVEKILVSDPKYNQGSEVRLMMGQNSALNGSEIVLRRDLEGMLAVTINTKNQDQFKKVVDVRNDIVSALEQHEDKSVRFEIYDSSENTDSTNNPFEESSYKKSL